MSRRLTTARVRTGRFAFFSALRYFVLKSPTLRRLA